MNHKNPENNTRIRASKKMKKLFCTILATIFFVVGSNVFAEPADSEQNDFEKIREAIRQMNKKNNLPFSIESRFFITNSDGHFKSDGMNFNGGDVGLKNHLNITKSSTAEFIIRYKKFSLDYIHLNDSGRNNLNGVLKFGNSNHLGDINSESDLHYIKFNVNNEIISLLGTGIDWTYGLTGVYWKGSANNSHEKFFAPLPTVGLSLHINVLPTLKIYSQLSGMTYASLGHVYDFESGLRYFPSKNFSITAGYRKIDMNIHHNGDRGNFKMNGPFAGVRVDF